MTNIWKAPFVIYTSSQNVGWYFGLRIIMTYKVFTDIKYLCYINWSINDFTGTIKWRMHCIY